MTPPNGPDDWAWLAKFAMLVRCGDAKIGDGRHDKPFGSLGEIFDVRLEVGPDQLAGASAVEPLELAEYLGMAWMEQAAELAAAADASSPREWGTTCPTCGAAVGSACEPTHAGERAPGRWVHPQRSERDPDALPGDRQVALRWSLENVNGPAQLSRELHLSIKRGICALAADRQRFKAERFALAGGMDRHGAVRQARLESCILLARQLEIELACGAGDLTIRETARRLVVDMHELGRGNRWARNMSDYAADDAANTIELARSPLPIGQNRRLRALLRSTSGDVVATADDVEPMVRDIAFELQAGATLGGIDYVDADTGDLVLSTTPRWDAPRAEAGQTIIARRFAFTDVES